MSYHFVLSGPDGAQLLYATEDKAWADRLRDFISQDWEGRKDEYEGFRHARKVIVTGVNEAEFQRACNRVNARANGIAPRACEAGQQFATLSALANHLGVTVAAVCNSLRSGPGKVCGVSFKYVEDYLSESDDNLRD